MLSHSTGHRSGQALQMTALWDCCRKRSSTRTMEWSRRVDLISPSAALPQNERWLNRIANSGELAADRQLALAERACAIRAFASRRSAVDAHATGVALDAPVRGTEGRDAVRVA